MEVMMKEKENIEISLHIIYEVYQILAVYIACIGCKSFKGHSSQDS